VGGENGREDDGVDERDGGDNANVGRVILGSAVRGDALSWDKYCIANFGDSLGFVDVRRATRIVILNSCSTSTCL
jgi:hypothetical protein